MNHRKQDWVVFQEADHLAGLGQRQKTRLCQNYSQKVSLKFVLKKNTAEVDFIPPLGSLFHFFIILAVRQISLLYQT